MTHARIVLFAFSLLFAGAAQAQGKGEPRPEVAEARAWLASAKM